MAHLQNGGALSPAKGQGMWRPLVIAALFLAGCSNDADRPQQSIDAARDQLRTLVGDRNVYSCDASIARLTELVEEMDFRLGMLKTSKDQVIARALNAAEIDFANRMHSYDARRAVESLEGPTTEAKRHITAECPAASQRMRADAQYLARYPALSRALVSCANGIDQVVAELAKRGPTESWNVLSGDARQCWARISEGAKADGISSSPIGPTAEEHVPTPTPPPSPSSTPEPQKVSSTRDEPRTEPDTIATDLASADAKLNQTWVRIRPRFSDEEWTKLRALQRQWIRDRDERCGTSKECLLRWTTERSDWLDRYRSPQ